MRLPHILYLSLNQISIHLPKRELLLFLMVLALPNDSTMGLHSSNCCSMSSPAPLSSARYCSTSFVLSVLPAPDSPAMMTDWGCCVVSSWGVCGVGE